MAETRYGRHADVLRSDSDGYRYAKAMAREILQEVRRLRELESKVGFDTRLTREAHLTRAGAYLREAVRLRRLEHHYHLAPMAWRDVDWYANNDPRNGWGNYFDAAHFGGRGDMREDYSRA